MEPSPVQEAPEPVAEPAPPSPAEQVGFLQGLFQGFLQGFKRSSKGSFQGAFKGLRVPLRVPFQGAFEGLRVPFRASRRVLEGVPFKGFERALFETSRRVPLRVL